MNVKKVRSIPHCDNWLLHPPPAMATISPSLLAGRGAGDGAILMGGADEHGLLSNSSHVTAL
jgi:hypothetical protein